MKFLVILLMAVSFIPVFSQSAISFDVDATEFIIGQTVQMTGNVDPVFAGQSIVIEARDGASDIFFVRTINADQFGDFALTFNIPEFVELGKFEIIAIVENDGNSFSETKIIDVTKNPSVQDAEETQEVSKFLIFLTIIAISVIVGGIIVKIKSKKDDKVSEEIQYEDYLADLPITERFLDMQADSTSYSVKDEQLGEIIDSKVSLISKLQEKEIGDYEKLEHIKKSLIDKGLFTEDHHDYLESLNKEYENSNSKDEKRMETDNIFG